MPNSATRERKIEATLNVSAEKLAPSQLLAKNPRSVKKDYRMAISGRSFIVIARGMSQQQVGIQKLGK